MDPRAQPSDEQFAEWWQTYGPTGVKGHDLQGHPSNKGCVAYYRELSLSERQVLSKLDGIEEEHPGAYDHMDMIVSLCLLYPTLEDYPQPAFAAAELFPRIRQHGHGPLPEESNDDFPESMAKDLREQRRLAFEQVQSGNLYAGLIRDLASSRGRLDPVALQKLWRMPPGRLRELAALFEASVQEPRKNAFGRIGELDIPQEEKKVRAEKVEMMYPDLFGPLDEKTGGKTSPASEETTPEAREQEEDPGNKPSDEAQAFRKALEDRIS